MLNRSLLTTCYQSWKINCNKVLIFFIAFVDLLNNAVCCNSFIQHECFKLAKQLLFTVSGQCKHSGKCCSYIQIRYDGKWLKNKQDIENIQLRHENMKRFKPTMKDSSIDYFSCSCLTSDNFCSSYNDRPKFCKTYPYSVLISDGEIHPGCGYYISQKLRLPFFASESLKKHIWLFKFNNVRR